MQLARLITIAHAGRQDGMPRVSCLGVGGGLNHLCEVELPEMFAELIGGLLSGVLMWLPMSQDLLRDPLCFVGREKVGFVGMS